MDFQKISYIKFTSPSQGSSSSVIAPLVVLGPLGGHHLTDSTPAVFGTAEPFGMVHVTMGGASCLTFADSMGQWSCDVGPPLADGLYGVSVTQTAHGNTLPPVTISGAGVVDTSDPSVVNLSGPSGGITHQNPISITVTFSEEMDLSTLSLSDFVIGNGVASALSCLGNPTVCTFNVVPSSEGVVSVDIAAGVMTDLAGNGNLLSNQLSIISDTTPPSSPVVISPTPYATVGLNFNIDVTCPEVGAVILVSNPNLLPDPTTHTCSSVGNVTIPLVFASGTVGTHYLDISVTDSAGNTSLSTLFPVTVLGSSSTTATIDVPMPQINAGNETAYTFTGTCSEIGEEVRVIVGGLEPSSQPLCQAGGVYALPAIDISSLSDGFYDVQVLHCNSGGNDCITEIIQSVVKDTTIPASPVIGSPSQGSTVTDATPTVNGTGEIGATVTVIAGGSTCTTLVDSAGNWSCDLSPALSNGSVIVDVTQTDLAGNSSPTTSVSVTISVPTLPDPVIVSPSPHTIVSLDFNLVVTCPAASVNLTITNPNLTPNPTTHACTTAGNETIAMTFATGTVGTHYLDVTASDGVNTTHTISHPVTISHGCTSVTWADVTPGVFVVQAQGDLSWVDYDGDLDLDLVATGYYMGNSSVHLYQNDGGGSFTNMTPSVFVPQQNSALSWADYDGDGDMDLVASGDDPSGSSIYLYQNDGGGNFVDVTPATFVGQSAAALSWGDYDSDGDLDLVASGYDSSSVPSIYLYRNDGGGNFSDQTPAAFNGQSYSALAWADYDGDGDLDLVASGYNSSSVPSIYLYRNDGGGNFSDQTPAAFNGQSYSALAWADYDKDGDLDLVASGDDSSSVPSIYLYRNDGGGIFSDQTPAAFNGQSYSDLAWADYDGDGDLDLVASGSDMLSSPTIHLYRNDGGGNFIDVTPPAFVGQFYSALSWGDYDGDGDIDLVGSGYDFSNHSIYLYENQCVGGSPSVTATIDAPAPQINANNEMAYSFTGVCSEVGEEVRVIVAGLEPSAQPICQTGNVYTSPAIDTSSLGDGLYHVQVLHCNTAGNVCNEELIEPLVKDTVVPSDPIVVSPSSGSGVGLSFTMDVTCPEVGAVISILNANLNPNPTNHTCTTTGNEAISISFVSGTSGTQVLSVVAVDGAGNTSQTIHHTLNVSGSCTSVTWNDVTPSVFSGQLVSALSWGDYDGDGDLDLVASGRDSSGNPSIYLYQNDGAGSFTDQTPTVFVAQEFSTLEWGDYDGDGDLDLVASGRDSSGNPSIYLYQNDGAGSFTDQTPTVFVGQDEGSLAWGDYDGDGDLDLVASGYNGSQDSIYLYQNDGGGIFSDQTPVVFNGQSDSALAWGDYDGDGDLDLVTSGNESNAAYTYLYRNDGGGSFSDQTPLNFARQTNGDLAWGDYDGDGDLDLVASGYDHALSATIFLYRNDGGGNFSDQTPAAFVEVSNSDLAWGDYDNDGDIDLVAIGANISTPLIFLYENDGGGNFSDQTPSAFNGQIVGDVFFGDYDGDGVLDLVTSGYNTSFVSSIYLYGNVCNP